MKRALLFSLLLICTYSVNIYADQIADELTKFAQSLQDLGSVISEKPATPLTKPLTPLKPAPAPTKPLTPLQPAPTPTKPLTPLTPAPEPTKPLTPLQPAPAPTKPLTPLVPVPTGPTMEEQIQTKLKDLEAIQNILSDFKIAQSPKQIPLSPADLSTWQTELQILNDDVKFLQTNTPDNEEAKTKLIAIKDSTVQFLVDLKSLATTQDQAAALVQYIDEFYTNGVAQTNYQSLLDDMTQSNETIEQLKKDLNAIINPVTPLVPVPTPTETQSPTPAVPAPTEPLTPTTPAVPDSYKPFIKKLIDNIQLDEPRIEDLFINGNTDAINNFMTKQAAQLSLYAQSFSDYIIKIESYYKYLTNEQKQIVLTFLNNIEIGLSTKSMKTLPNLEKAKSDVTTLLQKINPTEID